MHFSLPDRSQKNTRDSGAMNCISWHGQRFHRVRELALPSRIVPFDAPSIGNLDMNQPTPKTLVVIDRHKTDAYLLSEALSEAKSKRLIRIEHFTTIITTTRWLAEWNPSHPPILGFLIAMNLPDGLGIELAATIRADSRFSKAGIAFWTSDSMRPYTDRITKSKFKVLVKPDSFIGYIELIESLLVVFDGTGASGSPVTTLGTRSVGVDGRTFSPPDHRLPERSEPLPL